MEAVQESLSVRHVRFYLDQPDAQRSLGNVHLSQRALVDSWQWLSSSGPTGPGAGSGLHTPGFFLPLTRMRCYHHHQQRTFSSSHDASHVGLRAMRLSSAHGQPHSVLTQKSCMACPNVPDALSFTQFESHCRRRYCQHQDALTLHDHRQRASWNALAVHALFRPNRCTESAGSRYFSSGNSLSQKCLVLQSKRLTTFAELQSEVADVVRTTAATGPVPMQVDAVRRDQVGHAKKDCQMRNADMAAAQRDWTSLRRHGKKVSRSGVDSSIIVSFEFDLLMGIQRGMCGAHRVPGDR